MYMKLYGLHSIYSIVQLKQLLIHLHDYFLMYPEPTRDVTICQY